MAAITARELRARRAELLDKAEALIKAAELEDRDFSEKETTEYDGMMAEADALEARAKRLEDMSGIQESLRDRKAPAFNKTKLGDDETRAMAHFFRTGDQGGVSHLVQAEERGGKTAVVLSVPTQRETRAVVDSTINITTSADGGALVPTGFVQDIAARKNEMMLAERIGCRRVPGKGTTVNYPYENADPEEFATTSEQSDAHGNNYERDAGAFALKAFTLVKKTRKIELTEEILDDEDAGLLDYIAGRIAKQVAGTHNNMLITEAAANGTLLDTFASATAIAAGEPENLVFHDTLSYYLDEGMTASWILRPTTFGMIAKITGNARLYAETPGGSREKELLGYPAFYSNKVGAVATGVKSVFFGNWDFMGYREAPEMRFIQDPYSVDGMVVLKYSFRTVYGVLQAGAIGYGAQA